MDYVLVMPQPRGQITLPVKFRDKYNIKPGVQLKVEDTGDGLAIKPMGDPMVVMPKYSKSEIIKRLAKYEKNHQVYWTVENDKRLAELRKKDDKYLNW
jgi:AbrB family looped-hinge helix DNA binding protein